MPTASPTVDTVLSPRALDDLLAAWKHEVDLFWIAWSRHGKTKDTAKRDEAAEKLALAHTMLGESVNLACVQVERLSDTARLTAYPDE